MASIFGKISETLPKLDAPPTRAPGNVFEAIGTTAPYFYAKTDGQGGAIGYSQTETDTSGRPFFAFRKPGDEATTTDYTRTATKFDPRVAQPLNRDDYYNPRAEDLRNKLRDELGIAWNEELDHQIALTLSGSNNKANLKDIPKEKNREYGTMESKLAREVASGKKSLLDAQIEMAKSKGLNVPYPGTPEKSIWGKIGDAFAPDKGLGIAMNTILGLPKAKEEVASNIATNLKGMFTNPSPDEQNVEKALGPAKGPIDKYVAMPVYKTALRFLHPALQPFATNVAEIKALSEKGGIIDQVREGKLPPSILDEFAVLSKTAPQVIGDTAQAVLSAYGGGAAESATSKGLGLGLREALKKGFENGGVIGTLFGLSQAASSGSKNPLEILGMVGTGTAVGGVLGSVTGSVGPISKEVVSGLEKAKAVYDSIPNKQGGFVAIPGFGRAEEPKMPEPIAKILKDKAGEVPKAFNNPEIGNIDAIYGTPTVNGKKGYGIAKIESDHPEVLPYIDEALKTAKVVERLNKRVILETTGAKPVRLIVDQQLGTPEGIVPKTFLNNAYFVTREGIEPTASRVSNERSTVELPSQDKKRLANSGESVKGDLSTPEIPKELQSLAEEAKKYKSVEEFVNHYSQNPDQIPSSPEYKKYLSEKDSFVKKENDIYAQMKAMRDKYSGKTIKDVPTSDIIKYENLQKELSQTLSNKTLAKVPEGVIKMHIGEKGLKSELTDFYNKATGKVGSSTTGKTPEGKKTQTPSEQTPQSGQPTDQAPLQPREFASYAKDTTHMANSKVNVNTLDISPEGKALVEKTVEEVKPQIEKSVGQKLSNKEALKIASNSSKILERAVSRENTLEWEGAMLRARQALAKSAQDGVVDKNFVDALLVIKTQGADIARKLQSLSIGAKPEDITGKQAIIEAVLKVTDNADEIVKAAKGVDFTNLNEATDFYRKYVAPKATEWLDLIRYNSMLSSPKTHIVNIFSNAINSTVVPVLEKSVAGGVDFLKSAVTGKARTTFSGEAGAYAFNYLKNTREAFKRLSDVMTGKRVFTNLDTKNIPIASSGVKGVAVKALSFPLKLLEGMDQFFTALTEGAETGALKYRAGKGVKVGNIETQAIQKAAYRLYREGLTPETQGVVLDAIDQFTSKIQSLRNNKNPIVSTIAKFTVPFLRTPMNIFKQGIEYSPAGFSTVIGAESKIEQISKALIGSAVFGSAATLLMSNRLSWAEPINPKEKAQFRADGKQAYSVKIGNTWYSFQKLPPPIAFPFAMSAAIKDSIDNKKIDDNTVDLILTSIAKYGQFLADQSYMKSIGDVISAFKGGESGVEQVVSNYPQQLIPYRALSGWLARLTDTTQRKIDNKASFIDKQVQLLMMNIPGLSQKVPARLSPTGEPIPQPNPTINAISPINTSTEKSKDLLGLPPLPKLPKLAPLKGGLPSLPKLPKLNGKTSGGGFPTAVARILGINQAYAAELGSVPNSTVVNEDASSRVSRENRGFWQELIQGKKLIFENKTPEQTGKWLFDHGQSIPGEFTMYNPSEKQTDSSPLIMASGKKIYDGAIATSDYSMPLGTQVYVPELDKVFTVEDRMNRRYSPQSYGKTVFDIPTTEATSSDIGNAKKFGRQQLHFVIVGHDGRKEVKIDISKK